MKDGKTVKLNLPSQLVSERYFVFYPKWGWNERTQTSFYWGSAEFKEVSSVTQKVPPRQLEVQLTDLMDEELGRTTPHSGAPQRVR